MFCSSRVSPRRERQERQQQSLVDVHGRLRVLQHQRHLAQQRRHVVGKHRRLVANEAADRQQ